MRDHCPELGQARERQPESTRVSGGLQNYGLGAVMLSIPGVVSINQNVGIKRDHAAATPSSFPDPKRPGLSEALPGQ